MGKYLVLWEVDQTKIPLDPKERGEGWGFLMGLFSQLVGDNEGNGQNFNIGWTSGNSKRYMV